MVPTPELVRAACEEYRQDLGDEALRELFTQYPENQCRSHVVLKVVALNRIYSAGVLAVYDVAQHIHARAREIDEGLKAGDSSVVETIHKVRISKTGKERKFWSFATKYCSWHNPEKYPIWDSRVVNYLRSLGKGEFAHPDAWTKYAEYRALIDAFRTHYQLEEFTYKQIDMFMWKYGAPEASSEA